MSMTPDKTLEELASRVAYKVSLLPTYRWVDDKSISPIENKEAYREIALEALQSATAAQQREVEKWKRIAAGDNESALLISDLTETCQNLSEQLRTEMERTRALCGVATKLVAYWEQEREGIVFPYRELCDALAATATPPIGQNKEGK